MGWWTIFQLLTCRVAESNAFSIPDRNTSWNRTEDELIVQVVVKCSTSVILGRDWIDVTWEISGHLSQQCQERYRRVHILTDLTFVFLFVTFRGSPSYDRRTFSLKIQTRRILHDLLPLMSPPPVHRDDTS
jgi:hypothetical protein